MKRGLQLAIALGGIVPVAAGLAGVLIAPALTGDPGSNPDLDSHFRYLSGLLFAIGVAFWSTIPGVERNGGRVRILTAIVVAGGVARLYGLWVSGSPGSAMLFGLAMELFVTPLICLWQAVLARTSR